MNNLIKKLCDMRGISGFEYRINNEIKELFEPYSDEVSIDTLGNVIALKKSSKINAKKIMIEAHIDEIGLLVSDIDERGFISFVNVGGVDQRILPSLEVIIHGKKDIKGVIGSKPPHLQSADDEKKSAKISDMSIDTGLSKDEVLKYIQIGDSVTLPCSFGEILGDRISSKSLDDRASVAVLLEVMKNIKAEDLGVDVYAVAAVREEVGGYGAMTATHKINPDLAICIDVCHGITPDNSNSAYELDSGCVVTCGPNIHPKVFRRLIDTAKEHDIKTQTDVESGNTGTDAWVTQVVRCGVPTGLLSIPLKYMHTSVETASLNDIKATANLLIQFIKNLKNAPEDWLCL